jgi:ribosomal protein S18 acetylase RimI-like enzyme
MTSPDDPPRIRAATVADLPVTADLHARLLPHGLFPLLGAAFMRRWHATFLAGAPVGAASGRDKPTTYGVVLVAEKPDGEIVGFLVGTTDQAGYVSSVLEHHRRALTLAGARAMLVRPHVALHFLRTRSGRYARRLLRTGAARHRHGDDGRHGGTHARVAVVTAVAVTDAARGTGVGARLVADFLTAARAAGAPAAELVTKAGDEGASAFYARLGWTEADVHRDRDGDLVRRFRTDLCPSRIEGRRADHRPGAA